MTRLQRLRKVILATADDLASDFAYYGRKEDEQLPVGAIEEALAAGAVTPEEIAAPLLEWCRSKVAPTPATEAR